MITTTMNYTEIKAELLKDLIGVRPYADRVTGSNKYRRAALKHPNGVFFTPIFYESSRHNKYIILPYSKNKNDFKKRGLCYTLICYYFNKKNQIDVAMLSGGNDYMFFSGHLIKRYAERFLKNSTMNKIQMIVEYFKFNNMNASYSFESSKYPNSIIGATNDGIIIGVKEDHNTIFKTFLTLEMLMGEEIDNKEELLQRLDKLKKNCDNPEYLHYTIMGDNRMRSLMVA